MIKSLFCGLLDRVQTDTKRLIHHVSERGAKPFRNGSRPVQYVIIKGQCGSHVGIIASPDMVSRHRHTAGGIAEQCLLKEYERKQVRHQAKA